MFVCVCIHMNIYIYAYICMDMYIYSVHMYIYVYVYISCIYISKRIKCADVSYVTHTYIYAYTYIIYMYIYTHKSVLKFPSLPFFFLNIFIYIHTKMCADVPAIDIWSFLCILFYPFLN